MVDGGCCIGFKGESMATSGVMKCPEHVPLQSEQLCEPHGLAGSGIGNGRYEMNGPPSYHCGSSIDDSAEHKG